MVNDIPPDLAVLVVGAARVVADELGAAVRAAGVQDMRTPYGFVIRALADRDRTLTEVADLLAVSKQAAIKVVDEMAARGFLIRAAHPTDRRVKLLRLTPKGGVVPGAPPAPRPAPERRARGAGGGRGGGAAPRRPPPPPPPAAPPPPPPPPP